MSNPNRPRLLAIKRELKAIRKEIKQMPLEEMGEAEVEALQDVYDALKWMIKDLTVAAYEPRKERN